MEIMVVIAIILALAALGVGGFTAVNEKVRRDSAKLQIRSMSAALETYKNEQGDYPIGNGNAGSSSEVYSALFGDYNFDGTTDDGEVVYLATLDPNAALKSRIAFSSSNSYILVDPWRDVSEPSKNEYRYYRSEQESDPSQMNPDFDLWSNGPDGEGGPNGTEAQRRDDITNWDY